jgi:hypothetical protein
VSTAVSIQSSVAAELPVAQARDSPAGRCDECVAGGDQVQELHEVIDLVVDQAGQPALVDRGHLGPV